MIPKPRIMVDYEYYDRLTDAKHWHQETKAALYAVQMCLSIKGVPTDEQARRLFGIGILIEAMQEAKEEA